MNDLAKASSIPSSPPRPRATATLIAAAADTGYAPSTPVEVGIGRFVDWYRAFYKV